MLQKDYDVIVIAVGTAGTIAAIQSARAHSRTLLVEKNAMLGGTMTVAGRSTSSDREANSAIRVQCPCMAMGQAAGAMAALSARAGTDPEALRTDEIHTLLRQHGAIVPGDFPLQANPHWN